MQAIKVRHLSKTFEKYAHRSGFAGAFKNLFSREKIVTRAVDDVSFEIREGDFVGFIGPNGAGKTTTLKMLSGILHPSDGEVEVLGFKPFERKKAFQKQFAIVMGQKNQLWWDLPAIETFALNKAIYEIPNELYVKRLDELSAMLRVTPLLQTQVRKLSLGERMKCELIASLLHAPKVLFLDEPTIGLDVISQRNIREFLKQYNRKFGATIILTSHYMEDIRRLCERVIIINQGRIIYDGQYLDLVKKYADTKTIDMILSADVPRETLEKFGKVAEYQNGQARLLVPRDKITEITPHLLRDLPVEDISIHEETMEEIVSEIFESSR